MAERLAGKEAKVFHDSLAVIRRNYRRNKHRENLFLAKQRLDQVGFSVPDSMKEFEAAIGWPEKAVMVPARRIKPSVFDTAGGSKDFADEVNERFSGRYMRTMERMLIDASLRHGCSFAFVTPGDTDEGEPDVVVSARSALEATAFINRRTLQVTSGLEAIDRYNYILYLNGQTLSINNAQGELLVTRRKPNRGVPVVTYAWGRTLERYFGRSRITRPVIDYSGQAIRTMLRQEVHAEHFSSPQRILEGARQSAFTDKDGNLKDSLDIATGAIWGIPDFFDEETGEWRRSNLKQINASSMQPHTEQLRSIAMMFSGETGIPLNQLGIIQDNPSSAEAMRASETDLNTLVEAELPNYEDSRSDLAGQVMRLAHPRMAGLDTEVNKLRGTLLNPATTSLSASADWATKFVSANPWAAQSDVVLEMWGFTGSQLERLRNERNRLNSGGVLQQLLQARNSQQQPAQPAVPPVIDDAGAGA